MFVDLQFISAKRKEKKLTLQKMAEILGLKNASTYSKYEKGSYKIKAEMLPELASAFDCRLENFFADYVSETEI